MDIALRRCDIRLDGQTVVADGEVVAPEASRVRRA
jgi:2,5-dihydroxypyridine 5,6-dioxygenase